MITLRDKDNGQLIGSVTEEEFQVLVDALDEESDEDTDYYIEAGTIEMLEDEGAPESLVKLLRDALGTREGVEVAWSRS
jgi:processive 1,2-diacylglycerol beta-glucosyltransferase